MTVLPMARVEREAMPARGVDKPGMARDFLVRPPGSRLVDRVHERAEEAPRALALHR